MALFWTSLAVMAWAVGSPGMAVAEDGRFTVQGRYVATSGTSANVEIYVTASSPSNECSPWNGNETGDSSARFDDVDRPITVTDEDGNYSLVLEVPPNGCEFDLSVGRSLANDPIVIEAVLGIAPNSIKSGDVVTLDVDEAAIEAGAAEEQADLNEAIANQGRSNTAQGIVAVIILAAILGAMIFLYFWLAWMIGNAAERKGRSKLAWFVIAIFFLIPAAIIVAVMRNESDQKIVLVAPQPQPSAPIADDAMKTCPYCGESILAVAKKCKHCGEFLES